MAGLIARLKWRLVCGSEGFVCGSESLTYKSTNNEKNSEGDEVLNNLQAEKSIVISSVIEGASANVEGQRQSTNLDL
jgi:hypothetical protein